MRTPSTAAREAANGTDDALLKAVWERLSANERIWWTLGGRSASEAVTHAGLMRMSPEERRLYDIQEEK